MTAIQNNPIQDPTQQTLFSLYVASSQPEQFCKNVVYDDGMYVCVDTGDHAGEVLGVPMVPSYQQLRQAEQLSGNVYSMVNLGMKLDEGEQAIKELLARYGLSELTDEVVKAYRSMKRKVIRNAKQNAEVFTVAYLLIVKNIDIKSRWLKEVSHGAREYRKNWQLIYATKKRIAKRFLDN